MPEPVTKEANAVESRAAEASEAANRKKQPYSKTSVPQLGLTVGTKMGWIILPWAHLRAIVCRAEEIVLQFGEYEVWMKIRRDYEWSLDEMRMDLNSQFIYRMDDRSAVTGLSISVKKQVETEAGLELQDVL